MVASGDEPLRLPITPDARTPPTIIAACLGERTVGDPPASLTGYWRAPDHVLMLVTAGLGSHDIDFVRYPCRPGTVLWGRPGQVHRFGGEPGLDAQLLRFPPGAVSLPPGWELPVSGLPTCWQPTGEDEDAIVADVTQLVTDLARHDRGELPGPLVRHRLDGLLLRVMALPAVSAPAATAPALTAPGAVAPALTAPGAVAPALTAPGAVAARPAVNAAPAGAATLVLRLCTELERDVRHRPVEWYAARLGRSVRTVTRACVAVTGLGAKQLIDARIALEAKRLLATTTLPAAMVGRWLGFSEATNFGRFFCREVGHAPGAYRAAIRDAPRGAGVPPPAPARQRLQPLARLAPPRQDPNSVTTSA